MPYERRIRDIGGRAPAVALRIPAAEPPLQQVALIVDDADDVQERFLARDLCRLLATGFGPQRFCLRSTFLFRKIVIGADGAVLT